MSIKNTKTRSNDNIPVDELLLAEIIQNAKAFGLKSTRGSLYRDKHNYMCDETDDVVGCCAMGAMSLAPVTKIALSSFDLVDGNDANKGANPLNECECSSYTIGQCFYDACKPSRQTRKK